MKVLVIGAGGREHALAWKLAQSEMVRHVYVAPGNAGTAWPAHGDLCISENVPIHESDLHGLLKFAREHEIALTVVGPEAPLAEGIVDLFESADCPVFGPTQAAAQLEASKAYSKEFMNSVGIPTADYAIFTDHHEAIAYLATISAPEGVVVKASGLAAGKGVIVCDSIGAAQEAVRTIMDGHAFGEAGDVVIIEERLSGPELSLLAFCDGRVAIPMVPARDHKRAYDGDLGPNTGGMGAFAPVSDIDAAVIEEIRERVLQPVVDGMARRGTPYRGVLYAGLMLTPQGMKVLEFNCRFGDPETQVVLPLLDNDLAAVMMACIDGRLYSQTIRIKDQSCATVVMASEGYPGAYPKGRPISGIEAANDQDGVVVFQAGTKKDDDGQTVTSGGRVLAVSALGSSLDEALSNAYQGRAAIDFPGAQYRTDIGRTSPSS